MLKIDVLIDRQITFRVTTIHINTLSRSIHVVPFFSPVR